jgi:2-enoate reductase
VRPQADADRSGFVLQILRGVDEDSSKERRVKLFEPGKIGRLTIKNRIVMAPMGMGPITDWCDSFSQRLIDHYAAPAKGGTGLIITALNWVSREQEMNAVRRAPRISDPVHVERMNELANAVHDYGARIAVQLTAGMGRVIPEQYLGAGEKPIAPSRLAYFWNPSIMTRELTTEEVERLVEDFGHAAELVKRAEVDAIELHAHEGYLWDQFQTGLWNKRTDKYGGSLENRLRFPMEVIKAIKKAAGPDFPVIYRFGLKHYLPGGREVEEGLEIASRMEAAGVDALEIDAGCYETWYWAHPTSYQPAGLMVDMAEATKKIVKIPVMAIGKLGYPDLAEKLLNEGKADFICLGRALFADPEWPNKVREGRAEDIRPCIGDNDGCLGRLLESKYTSCTVNPTNGMERELALKPAEIRKSVLVVGGGPGGMEAARVASLRGHKVTLWEKSDLLGGNLIPASVPEFKKDYRDYINYLRTQLRKLGVVVELKKEATLHLIREFTPQAVFVATGATPIIPSIPGLTGDMLISAADALLGRKRVGESVVVVGGGLVGCETALYLSQKGKIVTVVEKCGDVARDAFKANREYLLEMLADAGVKILTDSTVLEKDNDGLIIGSGDRMRGKMKVRADSVICAVGFQPHNDLAGPLRDKVPEVYAIGDCVQPRKVMHAVWEGYRLARLL